MFDNLVESSSHKDDLSRKGSFILATTIVYAVLGVTFFVAGIYWYDAHLENQNLDLITLVAPVPVPQQQNQPEQKQEAKPQKVEQNVDVRRELIADVTRTELVPKEVSAKASDVPPVRKGVVTQIGSSDSNAAAPVAAGPGSGSGIVAPPKVDIAEPPPPPAEPPPDPEPRPRPRTATAACPNRAPVPRTARATMIIATYHHKPTVRRPDCPDSGVRNRGYVGTGVSGCETA